VQTFDVVVVGAGMVGSASAYGLLRLGQRVCVLDGGDGDFRAALANFGLVWVQGKGNNMPAYQRWTGLSSDLWPEFAHELEDLSGISLEYERKGGLSYCLGEKEYAARAEHLRALRVQAPDCSADVELLDRAALDRLLPGLHLGRDVTGASYCPRDGHVNPLRLLSALHLGIERLGGSLRRNHEVTALAARDGGFRVRAGAETLEAGKVLIAAGIGSGELARSVGIDVPLRPQRGQILVTERLAPFVPLPSNGIRQTADGTVMLGSTREEVGLDRGTTARHGAAMAARAIRIFPVLKQANLVRQWSGFRVMTPDSYPVFSRSRQHRGAFLALCHSGVTLAAVHARVLAGDLVSGSPSPHSSPFFDRSFDVPKAA